MEHSQPKPTKVLTFKQMKEFPTKFTSVFDDPKVSDNLNSGGADLECLSRDHAIDVLAKLLRRMDMCNTVNVQLRDDICREVIFSRNVVFYFSSLTEHVNDHSVEEWSCDAQHLWHFIQFTSGWTLASWPGYEGYQLEDRVFCLVKDPSSPSLARLNNFLSARGGPPFGPAVQSWIQLPIYGKSWRFWECTPFPIDGEPTSWGKFEPLDTTSNKLYATLYRKLDDLSDLSIALFDVIESLKVDIRGKDKQIENLKKVSHNEESQKIG